MPNTDPTQDSVSVVGFVREQGMKAGLCEVAPAASITIARAGEQLSPYAELASVGVGSSPTMATAFRTRC